MFPSRLQPKNNSYNILRVSSKIKLFLCKLDVSQSYASQRTFSKVIKRDNYRLLWNYSYKVTISLMRIFLISFPDPLSILYKKFHYNLWRSLLITFEIAVRWLEGNVKFIYKSAKVHYVFHHCLRFRFDDPVPKNGIIGTLATSMKMSLKNRLRILSNHFAIFPSRSVTSKKGI